MRSQSCSVRHKGFVEQDVGAGGGTGFYQRCFFGVQHPFQYQFGARLCQHFLQAVVTGDGALAGIFAIENVVWLHQADHFGIRGLQSRFYHAVDVAVVHPHYADAHFFLLL